VLKVTKKHPNEPFKYSKLVYAFIALLKAGSEAGANKASSGRLFFVFIRS